MSTDREAHRERMSQDPAWSTGNEDGKRARLERRIEDTGVRGPGKSTYMEAVAELVGEKPHRTEHRVDGISDDAYAEIEERQERSTRAAKFRMTLDDETLPIAVSYATTEQLFGELIKRSGEDTDSETGALRAGMLETPARAAKAWQFWCGGYSIDVDALFKTFEDGAAGYDEMVVVGNIPVHSHCEHHLAPITGVAHVAYIPNGRVVGLSKLPRVVDALSRRFQVQERLTVEIADAIERNLKPLAVGVLIEAEHSCMTTRGVRIHGGRTATSALRGAIKTEPSARAEWLALVERVARGQR